MFIKINNALNVMGDDNSAMHMIIKGKYILEKIKSLNGLLSQKMVIDLKIHTVSAIKSYMNKLNYIDATP